MKGFLFMGPIFMWIGILSIFGASFFMLTDAGYQCITGYGCDDVWVAAGRFFLAPQLDMAHSVDNIMELNEKLGSDSYSDLEKDNFTFQKQNYQKQIIASFFITLILFLLFCWLFIKSMTTLNATDYFFAAILAIAVMGMLQIVIGYIMTGEFSMPFIGFIKLFEHPEVMINLINYTEVLPLNQSLPTG